MKKIIVTTVLLISTHLAFTQKSVGLILNKNFSDLYSSQVFFSGAGMQYRFSASKRYAYAFSGMFNFPQERIKNRWTASETRYRFYSWEVNANFNYFLLDKNALQFYTITGLNIEILRERFSTIHTGSTFTSHTINGNFGLGGGYKFDAWILYIESKWRMIIEEQLNHNSFSMAIGIQWMLKKHERKESQLAD